MSKTVLSEVNGFTPLIDTLAQEHGVVTAAVFGRMWRYCQGDRGVCQATLERIGDDLGLDKATVQRHAAKLCELGYLEDMTPGLRNKPHTYRDTGKAALSIKIDVAHRNVTLQKTTSRCTPQRHVAESQLKKELKKEVKREGGAGAPAPQKQKGPDYPAVEAYKRATNLSPDKTLLEDMHTAIGTDPDDLAFWEKVVRAWVARGWRKNNIGGMFEYYERRELPSARKGQTAVDPMAPSPTPAL